MDKTVIAKIVDESEPFSEKLFKSIVDEILQLRKKKAKDYRDAHLRATGLGSILYELESKLFRAHSIINNEGGPENESLHDSFRDGAVYNILACCMIVDRKVKLRW